MALVKKVVLKAPKLSAGDSIATMSRAKDGAVPITVKEGAVTVEEVYYAGKNNASTSKLKAGDEFEVHVYLYPKANYSFDWKDDTAVCDVSLEDGTKVTSFSNMYVTTASGQTVKCAHCSYILKIPGTSSSTTLVNKVVLKAPKLAAGDTVKGSYYAKDGSVPFTVKEGAVTVECVYYDAKNGASSTLKAGDEYQVHVYLYPKAGYIFDWKNDTAVLDVSLEDGTKVTSFSNMYVTTASGATVKCAHCEYLLKIPGSSSKTLIRKLVLKAPQLADGDKLSFDYSVKEGPASIRWVIYERQSDNKFINYKSDYPTVNAGEVYEAHVYPYQNSGYEFEWKDGNAVCDVVLEDGTKLTSYNSMYVEENGIRIKCPHYSYYLTIPRKISSTSHVISTSLIPIKGISKKMNEKLNKLGVFDVLSLIGHCNTQQKRNVLARKLDVSVKLVNAWVKQADLWRISTMTTDLAYLLVQAGIRSVEDLSHVDVDKAAPFLQSLSTAQPDFDTVSNEVLQAIVDEAKLVALNSIDVFAFSNILSQPSMRNKSISMDEVQRRVREFKARPVRHLSSDLEFNDPEPIYLFADDYTS